jgi:AsmA protein
MTMRRAIRKIRKAVTKNAKRAIRMIAIIAGILIVIAAVLPFLVDVNSFRPKLEGELTNALSRQVKVGNLSLSIFSRTVSADNISIADDPAFSRDPFVTAKQLKVGVEVMPLVFFKTLHVTGITLDEPQITLLKTASGKWNFSSIGGSAPPAAQAPATEPQAAQPRGALSVDKLTVANGRLLLGEANSSEKPHVYDKVNVEVTNFSPASQFPFKLTAALPGGGDLSMTGTCGPINAGNTAATPFAGQIKVHRLDLAASGLVEASTGIQGLADFDATVGSNGVEVKSIGTLTAQKLKLAEKGAPAGRSLQMKYIVDHNLKTQTGTISEGEVSMGKAMAHLTGSYQAQGAATVVNMKLVGDSMPVDDLEAMLPAVGVVLPSKSQLQGGTLSVEFAIAGPTDKLVITGPMRLSNSKLAGFDLGSKLTAISALSGKGKGSSDTTIQNLSATVRTAPDGTQANNINLTMPALGVVTGAGTVSPAGVLSFKMNANLSGGAAGGMGNRGQGGNVPFMIEGTTSDPKFVPDVKGMAGSAEQQAIWGKLPSAGQGNNPADELGGLFGKKKK